MATIIRYILFFFGMESFINEKCLFIGNCAVYIIGKSQLSSYKFQYLCANYSTDEYAICNAIIHCAQRTLEPDLRTVDDLDCSGFTPLFDPGPSGTWIQFHPVLGSRSIQFSDPHPSGSLIQIHPVI